ncbi:MAG: hypothetical protein JJT76_03250 [Clostridiaceae bacterium]|nr:hypothetical protein [Clostridiaceae bacterium]
MNNDYCDFVSLWPRETLYSVIGYLMIIDQLNIPKEEVATLLINGRDGEFDRVLTEEDTVSIFPSEGRG